MSCPLCDGALDAEADVRWAKSGHRILQCPTCGLLFRATRPAPAELEQLYDVDYFKGGEDPAGTGYLDYVGDEDLHRAAARRRLDVLDRFAPMRGALLDVGAAAGFFVSEAQAHGWRASGLDVSTAMVEWGRSRLGVALDVGILQASPPAEASLDAVTMWDYLEHALDPDRDLRLAAAGLRARGLLALSTGDVESPVARLSGSRWHLLTPRHHNYFFSIRSLRALLDRTGFDVTSVTRPGARYSLRYLGHKLGAGDRLSRGPLGRVAVPVNLRDIVTVLATRR
jgi:2-polyprenyl-3-methyl-5-hydroxy-6-metoxy-1,4-benzoquinol methylase